MPIIAFPKCILCGEQEEVWACFGCDEFYCIECRSRGVTSKGDCIHLKSKPITSTKEIKVLKSTFKRGLPWAH